MSITRVSAVVGMLVLLLSFTSVSASAAGRPKQRSQVTNVTLAARAVFEAHDACHMVQTWVELSQHTSSGFEPQGIKSQPVLDVSIDGYNRCTGESIAANAILHVRPADYHLANSGAWINKSVSACGRHGTAGCFVVRINLELRGKSQQIQQIHDFSRFSFWGDCDVAQTFDGQLMPAATSGSVTGLGMTLSQTLIEAEIANATYTQAPVNC